VPYTPTANGCELVVDGSDPSVAALAWAPRGGGGGDPFTGLMTTVDGGMTWQAQPGNPFTRIDQLDSRAGVIYALRETADSAGSVEYHLWASSDRMASWRQLDSGQTLSASVAGFWLQPDGAGILAVVSGGVNAISTQLYYSPDNGATWRVLTVPGGLPSGYTPARYTSNGATGNGVVARAIQGQFHICSSTSTAGAPVSSGQTPVVMCSNDGGATWHSRRLLVVATPQQSNVAVNLVAIADDGDLLASGVGGFYRLAATSVAWQSLGTPPPVYVIYCSTPGSGLLWAIPSGPPRPGYIYTTYTANYTP
jgi:hypothetical protein